MSIKKEPQQKESLFRKEALEAKSAEELDRLLVVVRPKAKLSLAFVLALLTGFCVWSIVGKIPVDVHGRGIVLQKEGNFVIEGPSDAIIQAVYVREGDPISKNQLLMTLYSPEHDLSSYKIFKRNMQKKRRQKR